MTAPHAALVLFLLSGCAEYDMANKAEATDLSPADSAEDATAPPLDAVVVQVRPSGDADALPQAFLLDDRSRWSNADLSLQPTLRLGGTIRGYAAAPAAVAVPGEADAPVIARVEAFIPGDPNIRSTNSDADGAYDLLLPAGTAYTLSVVPITPAALPAAVSTNLSFTRDAQRDIDLGYGLPVTGRHTQSDGSAVSSSRRPMAYLLDPATGVAGAAARVDADGYFALRATPGSYSLVIEGEQGTAVPRLEIEGIEVSDDPADFAPLAIDAGTIRPADVSGRVVDAEGGPVSQATVRFTSLTLDEALGSLTIETATDQNGIFSRQLLPGNWSMAIIPAYEVDGESSPVAMEIAVPAEGQDFAEIALARRVTLGGRVEDTRGDPLPGVLVAIEESSFDHFVYTTTTNAEGRFSCSVPDAAVTVRIQPPNDQDVAITPFSVPDPKAAQSTYTLDRGTLIAGTASAADGALSYAVVEVRTPEGELLGTTLTDANGRYSLRIAD